MQKFAFLLFWLLSTTGFSQTLHTPSEIFLLMEKSVMQYQEDDLAKVFPKANLPLIEEGWQKDLSSGELKSPGSKLGTSKESKKYQTKGNNSFEKGQFARACAFYEKALAAETGLAKAYIRKQLCKSYLELGKTLDAGKVIQPLMESHQSDFGLHLLLAEIYQKSRQKDLAIQHITKAHLLNRNDPEILERLIQLYQENGKSFQKWNFNPQYEIIKKGKTVKITYQEEPWRAYAACRAVWQNEPTYAENMSKISTESVEAIEQKECLLNALIAFEQSGQNKEKFPELHCLANALPNNEINEFIIYEIESRKNPMLLYQMSSEELEKVIAFILKYHSSTLK